jgi:molybdopterin molybdotransferase
MDLHKGVTLEEARELILNQVIPLGFEFMPPLTALGRIISAPIASPGDLPPCHQAAVDGYAVHSDDLGRREAFVIKESLGSGDIPSGPLVPGQVTGVLTGGPVPGNTGAVVPQEMTALSADRLVIKAGLSRGVNIKLPGEDFKAGELLARQGDRVGPGLVGVMSAFGIKEIPVYHSPRVGIISLGQEVVAAHADPEPGQVRDCNGPLLASLVMKDGGLVTALETAGEDGYEGLRQRLDKMTRQADLVITVGGTASGACDYALRLLREISGRVSFWGVKIKPGSHSGAAFVRSIPVVSLSGNAAACAVGYHLLVSPVMRAFQGRDPLWGSFTATSLDGFPKGGGPRRFLRGQALCGPRGWQVRFLPKQKSSMIGSLIGYNVLVDLPAGHGPVEPHSSVTVIPVGPLRLPETDHDQVEGGNGIDTP